MFATLHSVTIQSLSAEVEWAEHWKFVIAYILKYSGIFVELAIISTSWRMIVRFVTLFLFFNVSPEKIF